MNYYLLSVRVEYTPRNSNKPMIAYNVTGMGCSELVTYDIIKEYLENDLNAKVHNLALLMYPKKMTKDELFNFLGIGKDEK